MEKSLRDKKEFLFAGIAWWTVLGIIYSVMLTGILKKMEITVLQVVVDTVVSNLFLTACWILIVNNMRYYLPRREKYWYILIISIAMSVLCTWLSHLLLWFIFRNDAQYLLALSQTTGFRFGISFLLIACMAIVSLLWYTQEEQKASDERKADAEKFSKEAELFKLRQQLQPHFLFNSLNSISALTGTQPEKARHMIQQLSDFLRGTMRKENDQWSSLKEEIAYLELYLDIEKVRFGHRLQTSVLYDEKILEMKLPSLLLQPVVENAIKFGLYDTIGEVLITIEAKAINDTLKIIVKNPFDAETSQPLKGTGFGLSSIQRRLFLLFARKDLLLTKTEDENFITTIIIPQIQTNN
jgi:sensor histidine kinase YesM